VKPTHWFMLGFALTALEIVIPGFVIFWFGIAGVVTGLIALILPSIPAQVAIFVILSGVLVAASQRIARRWNHATPKQVGSERMIGAEGLVTSSIQPPAPGMVEILGELWGAESSVPLEAGRLVHVERVVGTHVVVKPSHRENAATTEAGGQQ
jgi:membrane protein implicated in regulation of membrane protease activity